MEILRFPLVTSVVVKKYLVARFANCDECTPRNLIFRPIAQRPSLFEIALNMYQLLWRCVSTVWAILHSPNLFHIAQEGLIITGQLLLIKDTYGITVSDDLIQMLSKEFLASDFSVISYDPKSISCQ